MILSLLNRNQSYKYLFFGRLTTNIGDSIYSVASAWLVYHLSGNVSLSGLAYALGSLPSGLSFLLNPLINSKNPKYIIIFSQLFQFILISIVFLLSFFNILNIYILLTIIPIASLCNSIAYYAENSIIPSITDKDDLTVANSGMSLAYQGTDLFFNAIAGFILAMIGATSLFAIDAISFLIAVILFLRIKFNRFKKSEDNDEKYLDNLKDGYESIKKSVIWPITLSTAVVNFFFGASLAIMPAFSDKFGDAKVYGLFLAGLSIGILLGSLLAPKFEGKSVGFLVPACFFLTGVFWLFFINLTHIPLMILSLILACLPIGVSNVILITLPQKIIHEDKIMKVFSIQGSINTLGMPLGGILGGIIAHHLGIRIILICTGLTFIVFTIYWISNRQLRIIPNLEILTSQNT